MKFAEFNKGAAKREKGLQGGDDEDEARAPEEHAGVTGDDIEKGAADIRGTVTQFRACRQPIRAGIAAAIATDGRQSKEVVLVSDQCLIYFYSFYESSNSSKLGTPPYLGDQGSFPPRRSR